MAGLYRASTIAVQYSMMTKSPFPLHRTCCPLARLALFAALLAPLPFFLELLRAHGPPLVGFLTQPMHLQLLVQILGRIWYQQRRSL